MRVSKFYFEFQINEFYVFVCLCICLDYNTLFL